MKSLLEAGADVNITSNNILAPLYIAAQTNSIKMVTLLLADKEINPNIQDELGNTPLHVAVSQGHLDSVKLLLNHEDINPNLVNKDQKRPIDLNSDDKKTDEIKRIFSNHPSNDEEKAVCRLS